MKNQLELPMPRRRVRLEDAAEETPAQGDVAEQSSAQDVWSVFLDASAVWTRWDTRGAPPSEGFWDVTDSRTGTLRERWWYSQERGPMTWTRPDGKVLMHDEFVERCFAWRGLQAPAVEGYPTPPYSLSFSVKAEEALAAMQQPRPRSRL